MADHDDGKSQLAENVRFYGEMRFKQLTLFMAAMTAVAGGIAQFPQNRWWIALAGIYVTAVMWVMEVRSSLYGFAALKAAGKLWPSPEPKLFPWLTATLVVSFLYIGFYAFWLACVRLWCRTCASFYLGLVIDVALVAYITVNYWHHRRVS